MLRLEGVIAGYGPTDCLKGISLEVRAGEIVALLGANGAGKTTTLMTISGLVRARQGTIDFAGERLTWDRACAGGTADFPKSERPRKPPARRLSPNGPPGDRPGSQEGVGLVSEAARARVSTGGHALRRRAADALDGPRIDGGAQAAVAR